MMKDTMTKVMVMMMMLGVGANSMVDGTTTGSTASRVRMTQQDDNSGLTDAEKNVFNKVPLGLNETKLSKVKLPKPLSDFSTIYDSVNNNIYITGGCDSINGNQFVTDGGFFSCSNASDNHYMIFAPDMAKDDGTTTFTTLASMPTPRYRHTAILLPATEQILFVGGRSVVDDSIIPTVDVYNIGSDTWTVHNVTDPKYLLSDNTGNEYMNRAYVFGGWNSTYTAQSTSFYMEILDSGSDNETVVFVDIADLPTARGDTSSVSFTSPIIIGTNNTNNTVTYALVTGGFTHENLCYALDTVEQYNFNTDTWTTEHDPLNVARGDKALVRTSYSNVIVGGEYIQYTQHLVYALGGERPIENYCNITAEVGTESVPIDDIEYYDIQNNTWTRFPNNGIDVYRFRFSAVVDTDTNVIYSFGGQLAFNESCTCFPTSDEIYMFTEIFADNNTSTTPPGKNDTSTKPTSSSSDFATTMKMMMNVVLTFAVAVVIF